MEKVDACGLACPQPVILAKKAMQAGEVLVILVDNEVAVANVSRMARASGWEVQQEKQPGGTYALTLAPPHGRAETTMANLPQTITSAPSNGPLVVLLASDTVGRGDDTLGEVLMRAFLHTLQEVEPKPDVIICMNGGVKLAAKGKQTAEDLEQLEHLGVELVLCGTCVDFFKLKEKIEIGTISNMYTIAEMLLNAGTIMRL